MATQNNVSPCVYCPAIYCDGSGCKIAKRRISWKRGEERPSDMRRDGVAYERAKKGVKISADK